MTNIFIRVNNPTRFDQLRDDLDASMGFPNSRAETCLPTVDESPRDGNRVLVAVPDFIFDRQQSDGPLKSNVTNGTFHELTEQEYRDLTES